MSPQHGKKGKSHMRTLIPWLALALVSSWLALHAVPTKPGTPAPAVKCGGVIDPWGVCHP
jgi:hypothetical protein